MFNLLNSHTVVFRQYQKKYWILRIAFIYLFIYFFIYLFILEYTFQIKIVKLSIGSFIEVTKMYVLSA